MKVHIRKKGGALQSISSLHTSAGSITELMVLHEEDFRALRHISAEETNRSSVCLSQAHHQVNARIGS